MKKIILMLIIGLCSFNIKIIAQNNPSESAIIKATKSVIAFKFEENELQDFIRYSEDPIKFIHGNFTGLNRKECLVICPMMRQTGTYGAYQNFIMLFYKMADGTWSKGRFAVIEQEVDTMDLNNDNLPELICKNGGTWMGETHEIITIYQLKGDNEKELYSVESVSYSMYLEVGKEAEKIYEVSFIDTNNDGIMELEEKLAKGIVESIYEEEAKLYYKKSKRILKIINGTYQ